MESRLLTQLKRHEGRRLRPYRDTVGKLTIGYGRNLDDNGITEEEAELLLVNDVRTSISELERFTWFAELNSARQGVLINMHFNIGLPSLLSFRKMIQAIKDKNYHEAAEQMLDSKWARQVGVRALELSEQMGSGTFFVFESE